MRGSVRGGEGRERDPCRGTGPGSGCVPGEDDGAGGAAGCASGGGGDESSEGCCCNSGSDAQVRPPWLSRPCDARDRSRFATALSPCPCRPCRHLASAQSLAVSPHASRRAVSAPAESRRPTTDTPLLAVASISAVRPPASCAFRSARRAISASTSGACPDALASMSSVRRVTRSRASISPSAASHASTAPSSPRAAAAASRPGSSPPDVVGMISRLIMKLGRPSDGRRAGRGRVTWRRPRPPGARANAAARSAKMRPAAPHTRSARVSPCSTPCSRGTARRSGC